MRIALMSDLRLEFDRDRERSLAPDDHPHRLDGGYRRIVGPDLRSLKECAPDVLVLAGDIDVGLNGFEYARQVRDYLDCPVVMVAGNHEFYGHDMLHIRDLLRWEQEHDRDIHILDNSIAEIDGVRFIGTTLWTDFELFGQDRLKASMDRVGSVMSDYRLIVAGGEPLRPRDTRALHQDAIAFLALALASEHNGPTVVVSHHAPHPSSVPQNYRSEEYASAYASDLTGLITIYRPDLWLHGHTHAVADHRVGDTRVVANPRGYFPKGLVTLFRPDRIIDLCGSR